MLIYSDGGLVVRDAVNKPLTLSMSLPVPEGVVGSTAVNVHADDVEQLRDRLSEWLEDRGR